jgi:hypothetical protein
VANIKAKIRRNPNKITAQTLKIGNVRLTDLTDVDASGAADGALLLYNGNTNQFAMTTILDNSNTNITGGTY